MDSREQELDNTLSVNTQPLADMIDALNGEGFLPVLFTKLALLCPFEMAALFIYRDRSRPLCLYNSFKSEQARLGINNYLQYSYVLNPFYQAYLNDLEAGVYRIQELAPDAYYSSEHHSQFKASIADTEEIGYVTDDWPKQREEVSIAILLAGGAVAEMSLLRPNSGGFKHADLETLRGLEPILGALMRNFWNDRESHQSQGTASRIDEAFENFGKPELTDRECKVVQLILRGHSTLSISLNLQVAITTIKTHRKNAYLKLNISTQSELLSIFINSLKAMGI